MVFSYTTLVLHQLPTLWDQFSGVTFLSLKEVTRIQILKTWQCLTSQSILKMLERPIQPRLLRLMLLNIWPHSKQRPARGKAYMKFQEYRRTFVSSAGDLTRSSPCFLLL